MERWTRRYVPPVDRWTIWRRVASLKSAGGKAFCGSGICCDAPQVAIQRCGAAWVCAHRPGAREKAANAAAIRVQYLWVRDIVGDLVLLNNYICLA